MTADEIIAGVLEREGGWREEKERPNGSVDPPTNHGITLDTLRRFRQRDFPGAVVTEQDLRQLTPLQARGIYEQVFIAEPGFTVANIPYEPLRVQLIDFGVNSGPERAIRWLQRVLRFAPECVTGKMDRKTVGWLQNATIEHAEAIDPCELVNDALVAARSYMIDRAEDQGTIRSQDEEGLESRALSFFLATPAP